MGYLIMIITFLYANLDSLTQSNFTVIGNTEGHLLYFIAWTFLLATYFLYYSSMLMKKFHYSFKYQKLVSLYIYSSCILTPFIPYTENSPILDDLHVFLAFSSATLFLIVWLFFLNHIKQTNPGVTKKIEVPFYLMIHALALILLYFGRINSIVELVIIISMIFLIEFLKKF